MLDKMPYKRGFSLVEITIVLLVLSVLAAGGLSVYQHHDSTSRTAVTLERIEAIERAFADFRSVQHRLPCPADPTLREHEAGFGAAGETPGHCRSGDVRSYAREGYTAVGAVPTRALKLPDSHMYDGWGRRFTYYVDSRVTAPMALLEYGASDECVGSIRVNDSTSTARTERAIYALVSHGLNGHGAFLPSGERRNANSSNAAERANAGVNAALADNYGQPLVKQRPTRNSSNHADSFDDIVRYKERWAIFGGADGVKSVANSNKREKFVKIANGQYTSCGLTNRNGLYCWGHNSTGTVGDGTTVDRQSPTPVVRPLGVGVWTDIQMGGEAACAIDTNRTLYCWGANRYGLLGDGTTENRLIPTPVKLPTGVSYFRQFEMSPDGVDYGFACAIGDDSQIYCWGRDYYGRLGSGNSDGQRSEPTPIVKPSEVTHFKQFRLGSSGACAIANDDALYCWGLNTSAGRLGFNGTVQVSIPRKAVTPVGVNRFIEYSLGGDVLCAIADNGQLYCAGEGRYGGIGDGNLTSRRVLTPVQAPPSVTGFKHVNSYASTPCAISNDNRAYCWGRWGVQRGDGNSAESVSIPTLVALPSEQNVMDFRFGAARCARLANKDLYCWGNNTSGQVGDGTTTAAPVPVQVVMPQGVRYFQQYWTGVLNTVALGDDGYVYVWGSNRSGQLGLGFNSSWWNVRVPTRMPYNECGS